jgi:hypothetical protein
MRRNAWFEGRRFRFARPVSWQLWLLLAVAAALGVAVTIVAAGVFLVAIPIVALAFLGYRAWAALAGRRATPRRRGAAVVIEGDYEVVRESPETPPRREPAAPGKDSPWRK